MKTQKLQTEIFAFADYALLDQTNKLSIMGIFNQLNVVNFPGGLPKAFLVATFVGAANTTYKLTFTVQDDEKKDVFPAINVETKTSFTGKTNVLVAINNFVFPHAGEFTATIMNDGKEVGVTTIDVTHAKQNATNPAKN